MSGDHAAMMVWCEVGDVIFLTSFFFQFLTFILKYVENSEKHVQPFVFTNESECRSESVNCDKPP